MLKISKDNIQFALADNIQIPWVFRSPLLVSDYSSRTGPFELDAKSQVNQFLLNYPNRLSKLTQSNTNIEVNLEMNSFKKSVLLKLQEASNTKIKGLILFDNGRFYNLTKDKSLLDYDFGSVFLGDTPQDIVLKMEESIDKTYPECDYNFPTISMPHLYGQNNDSNPAFKGIANHRHHLNGYYFNEELEEAPNDSNLYTIIPGIYLFSILDKLFKHVGYSFDAYKQMNNEELNSLCLISNSTLDLIKTIYFAVLEITPCDFPSLLSPLEAVAITFEKVLSDGIHDGNSFIDLDNSKITIKEKGTHKIRFSFDYFFARNPGSYTNPPEMTCNIFIDENEIVWPIMNSFVYAVQDELDSYVMEFEYYFDESYIGKNITLRIHNTDDFSENPGILSISNATVKIENLTRNSFNGFQTNLNYNDHIPDIPISDFISLIENLTCSVFSFNDNDRSVSVHFWKDILTDITYKEDLGSIVADSIKVDYSNLIRSLSLEYLNSPTIDLSDYNRLPDTNDPPLDEEGNINDIIFCTNANAFYLFSIPERESEEDPYLSPTWQFLCSNNFKFDFDSNTKETEQRMIKAIIPQMCYAGTFAEYTDNALMPLMLNSYSPAFPEQGGKANDINLVFFRGSQFDKQNRRYPLATPLNLTRNGIKIGELSLNPEDVIVSFYQAYLKWVLRRYPIELKSHLTLSFLKNIAYARKHRLNGINFLIESLEVGMSTHTLSEASIRLFST